MGLALAQRVVEVGGDRLGQPRVGRTRRVTTQAPPSSVALEQVKESAAMSANAARNWYRTDIIVMALVVYGLQGLTADGIVRFLERTLLAWRRGFVGT